MVIEPYPGDLVKPNSSCGGEPGAKRCDTALVAISYPNTDKVLINCPCGSNVVYRQSLELIAKAHERGV